MNFYMTPRFSFTLLILFCIFTVCSCVGMKSEQMAKSEKLQVAELLKQINENPDLLHYDYTPAVYKLIGIGRPALRFGVLELLLSKDRDTRMHAQRVLEGVTLAEMGFERGYGWPNGENGQEKNKEWQQLWESNGAYSFDAPEEVRQAAYDKWQQWLLETDKTNSIR